MSATCLCFTISSTFIGRVDRMGVWDSTTTCLSPWEVHSKTRYKALHTGSVCAWPRLSRSMSGSTAPSPPSFSPKTLRTRPTAPGWSVATEHNSPAALSSSRCHLCSKPISVLNRDDHSAPRWRRSSLWAASSRSSPSTTTRGGATSATVGCASQTARLCPSLTTAALSTRASTPWLSSSLARQLVSKASALSRKDTRASSKNSRRCSRLLRRGTRPVCSRRTGRPRNGRVEDTPLCLHREC
mmetsp:Transcript_5336/g.11772  ORF Transcript_5336/g.11772 Transcript_5336/m.11772 type:complete len:242 (-) Transcript_5336:213-938(-)